MYHVRVNQTPRAFIVFGDSTIYSTIAPFANLQAIIFHTFLYGEPRPVVELFTGTPTQRIRHGKYNMKTEIQGDTLKISELNELGAANWNDFRDRARAAMTKDQKNIDVDLSMTLFLDSCGLGALISLHKTTCSRNGAIRLLYPTPSVRQILELTRMQRLFEIVTR